MAVSARFQYRICPECDEPCRLAGRLRGGQALSADGLSLEPGGWRHEFRRFAPKFWRGPMSGARIVLLAPGIPRRIERFAAGCRVARWWLAARRAAEILVDHVVDAGVFAGAPGAWKKLVKRRWSLLVAPPRHQPGLGGGGIDLARLAEVSPLRSRDALGDRAGAVERRGGDGAVLGRGD